MNAKILFAATLAIAAGSASTLVRADEADASQFVIKTQSSRTRAEVMAEAAKVSATRSTEPNGSRVIAAPVSDLSVQAVHAEAVQALRQGKIPSGEASF